MILLDTHAAIWLLLEPARLSAAAKRAIRQCRSEGSTPAISSVSLYEIARAIHRKRIEVNIPAEEFLRRLLTFVRAIPPTAESSLLAAQFPSTFPLDPMDRLIAATAIIEGASLITADRNIRRLRLITTIW